MLSCSTSLGIQQGEGGTVSVVIQLQIRQESMDFCARKWRRYGLVAI
jgi:hypothetical protein